MGGLWAKKVMGSDRKMRLETQVLGSIPPLTSLTLFPLPLLPPFCLLPTLLFIAQNKGKCLPDNWGEERFANIP